MLEWKSKMSNCDGFCYRKFCEYKESDCEQIFKQIKMVNTYIKLLTLPIYIYQDMYTYFFFYYYHQYYYFYH